MSSLSKIVFVWLSVKSPLIQKYLKKIKNILLYKQKVNNYNAFQFN